MKGFICFLGALLIAAAAHSTSAFAQDSGAAVVPPRQEVQSTVDDIVQAVAAYPGEDKAHERRSKLRSIIEPKFDFQEMAKRSLGAKWNDISSEQQDEFVRVFSDLLAKTYLNRIENVRSNMVKVDSELVRDSQAIVKTTVTDKGSTFPIDYKLLKKETAWRVYDVVIENIGLVANYRNEFSGIIRKEKFEGLLQRLKDKMEA